MTRIHAHAASDGLTVVLHEHDADGLSVVGTPVTHEDMDKEEQPTLFFGFGCGACVDGCGDCE